jgi:hypothetical protein
MNRLMKNYTYGCDNCGGKIAEKLGANPSDEIVREHFLVNHNITTLDKYAGVNLSHLAIPYHASSGKILQPFYKRALEQNNTFPDSLIFIEMDKLIGVAKDTEIILQEDLEEIVVAHAGLLRDTMTRTELDKYLMMLK